MPEIKFTDRELNATKQKAGVYSQLKNKSIPQQQIKLAEQVFESLPFVEKLRKELYKQVNKAFKEYCRKHGCQESMLKTEVERFNKILEKYL